MTPLERVTAALEAAGLGPVRDGRARCPAHEDGTPSLSIRESQTPGGVALKCFAGCDREAVLSALGLRWEELYPRRHGGEGVDGTPSPTGQLHSSGVPSGKPEGYAVHGLGSCARPAPSIADLTLASYAEAKGLAVEFLVRLGLRDQPYQGGRAVRIPYLDEGGEEAAIRYRLRLDKLEGGDGRFRWRTGSKVQPYGLWRLANARALGRVVLVEGESDAHTLWRAGIPALGIPGGSNWRTAWASILDGIGTVFVVKEPDQGGATLVASLLRTQALRDRLRIVDLGEAKDVSGLYLRDPDGFERAFAKALDRSAVAVEEEQAEAESERSAQAAEARSRCADLAWQPDILALVEEELKARGLVGDLRLAKVVYLATTSRLLDRPVSVVAKGPSSAGKSFETERALELFPPEAIYALSGMSERALAYSEESLSHRMLVIYEAAGLEGDFASYLLRSLLSEGCIRYETVEKTSEGVRARLIERPGPTGAILTTTRLALHPENETRLLSVPVDDSRRQTRDVLGALAADHEEDDGRELDCWHALQRWLALAGDRAVAIPFAEILAKEIPDEALAVRVRRDFGLFLNLVRAHAILHQATRGRDGRGRIVATVEGDYAAVHRLAADLLGAAAAATVPPSVRETVAATSSALTKAATDEVGMAEVADELGLDRSATSRRVRAAVQGGYLENRETKRGRPARLTLAAAVPDDRPFLPEPGQLIERLHDCTGVHDPLRSSSARSPDGNGGPVQQCSDKGDLENTPAPAGASADAADSDPDSRPPAEPDGLDAFSMPGATAILAELRSRRARVHVLEDGRLGVEPRAALTDELRATIRARRDELVALVRAEPPATRLDREWAVAWARARKLLAGGGPEPSPADLEAVAWALLEPDRAVAPLSAGPLRAAWERRARELEARGLPRDLAERAAGAEAGLLLRAPVGRPS